MVLRKDLQAAVKRSLLEAEGIALAKQAMREETRTFHLTSIGETIRYSPNLPFDFRNIDTEGRAKVEAYAAPVSLALFKGIRAFEETYGEQPKQNELLLLNIWIPGYNEEARNLIKKFLIEKNKGELAIQWAELRRVPQTQDFLALDMLGTRYPHVAMILGWKTATSGDFLSTKIIQPTEEKIATPMLELITQSYNLSRAPSPFAGGLGKIFRKYYDLFTGRYDLKEEEVYFE